MNFFLGIQDFFTGTEIRKTYRFLKESEKWSEEELGQYKLNKLQLLVKHAFYNTRYYSELFEKEGIHPDDITSFEAFSQIPILTKEIIRQRIHDLIPTNISLSSPRIKKGKTGGTTGPPIPLYKDISTRNFTWGAYYRWYDWMGIRPNDRIIVLWGDAKVLNKDIKSILKIKIRSLSSNTNLISTFNLNDETIPGIVDNIIENKPVLIRGYLSAILQIGKYISKNNIAIPSLKAISTTTETLLPHYREFIQQTFHVPVYDQYGCGECGSIAFECTKHSGLHITEEHAIIEILDNENSLIINQPRRLILTDLDNYAMPFIRYENGDIASISEKKCSCGINSQLLIAIEGRSADTIVLKNGSAVHGVFFTDILSEMQSAEVNKILRFQIYQKKAGEIEFRIESDINPFSRSFIEELQINLNQFFTAASIKIYRNLQNDKNGKFRYIISELISV